MATPVRKGDELEVRIDSLAYGGNGVGRVDGFVVFVRGALPGDLVRARATKVKRGFAEAIRTALLDPGPVEVPRSLRVGLSGVSAGQGEGLDPVARRRRFETACQQGIRRADVADADVRVGRQQHGLGEASDELVE